MSTNIFGKLIKLIIIGLLVASLLLPYANVTYDIFGVKLSVKSYYYKECLNNYCQNYKKDDYTSAPGVLTTFILTLFTITILTLCLAMSLFNKNYKLCKIMMFIALIGNILSSLLIVGIVIYNKMNFDTGSILLFIATVLFLVKKLVWLFMQH